MKAGKYTLKELFVNRYVQQIIIPEIQRDYVWGEKQVISLVESLRNDFGKFAGYQIPSPVTGNAALAEEFHEFYRKRHLTSSIGFIYAYHDDQYPGRYFLIDGQQRITTIYLLLLALAQRHNELKKDFLRTYTREGSPKLDYKVREASHEFLSRFVFAVLDGKEDIRDQRWYHNTYENDKTIEHLLANYAIIKAYIQQEGFDQAAFYHFLQDQTECWYFDTNISEQGEELYIYMNARGEQTQGNENIKADLLSHLGSTAEKNEYGKTWERWQDFFWLKRNGNENADKGFNEFLACISGLELYLKGDKKHFLALDVYNKVDESGKKRGITVQEILKTLNLSRIKRYVDGLQFLENNIKAFKSQYNYCGWLEKCLAEFWQIINGESTNWYADYNDDNRGTERNRMVFVWSILHFLSLWQEKQHLSAKETFRALRLFYVRYHNYDRSVSLLATYVSGVCDNGPWKSSSYPEEHVKHVLLNAVRHELVQEFEELIWEIEDHDYNLDGSGVGGINIRHLVDFNGNVTLASLKNVRDKFYQLFPSDRSNNNTIQNLLLYYGPYWYSVSPNYYSNLKFDSWRRIIRDVGDNQYTNRVAFRTFFNEFLPFQGNLNDLLAEKRKAGVMLDDNPSLQQVLLWYNQQLGDKMWAKGNYIASSMGSYCGLTDWQGKDRISSNFYILYNTTGDLRNGSGSQMYSQLSEEVKRELKGGL